MIVVSSRIVWCGVLFLLTLLSGFWVAHSGRPLNMVIVTIHKLISLATVVLTGITMINLLRALGIRSLVDTGLTVLTGLIFLALLVSGGLLSMERPAPRFVLLIHQIAPWLAVAAAAASVYLLSGSKS